MKKDKEIIEPIAWDVIEKELKEEYWVRKSNKGNFDIYIIDGINCPEVMKEIGRLREISFRDAGGGTGNSIDVDDYDLEEPIYKQLILVDWNDKEIVGGYRYIYCADAYESAKDEYHLSTSHYFDFSTSFKELYLPRTIELGRSWIQPKYQFKGNARKGIFALSSLWDGLGSLLTLYPDAAYFFGKVTMYPHYHSEARDLLLRFLNKYFPDQDQLVLPINPLELKLAKEKFEDVFDNVPYAKALQTLKALLKDYGESVPPLINLYMGLSQTMKCFGTAVNPDFGDVEETGILVTIADIDPAKRKRHT